MQENRMFSDVKLAKRLTPAWLSPFLAVFLLVVGQIIGAIVMSISAALIIAPYYMTHPDLPDRLSDSLNLRDFWRLLSSGNASFLCLYCRPLFPVGKTL